MSGFPAHNALTLGVTEDLLVHVFAGAHRAFAGHDLSDKTLFVFKCLEQIRIKRPFGDVVVNLHCLVPVALPDDAAVALSHVGGLPSYVQVMHRYQPVLHVGAGSHFCRTAKQNAHLSGAHFGEQFLLFGLGVRRVDEGNLAFGKTAKSILISCGARLSPFDIAELREITTYDELELDTLGDRKTALFLIMSDTDSTFNFLISMVYTQLFNLLCEKADDVYGGRLPVHVRCLIDECANIGQIPNLEKLVATIRSREISACLVLQAQSQLKALYKDNADTIIGNMDSQIFLGGSENTTLKELSATLGRETIDMYNTSDTRGNSPSYGTSYQKTGHELMSRDELAVMDGGKCILQLRGVRPFLSNKYDLTQHPNYKLTGDYDKKNLFDIEKFLDRRLKLKPSDVYDVVDADSP